MKHFYDNINFFFQKKLTVFLQSEAAECGLACIAMITNFYGQKIDLIGLRRLFKVSLSGLNFGDLIRISAQLGFTTRAVQLNLDELKFLSKPAILHWEMNHFVVLKRVTSKSVIIIDPAKGQVSLSIEEVSKKFTGVALELEPNESFKIRNIQNSLSIKNILHLLNDKKSVLIQVFLISFVCELLLVLNPIFFQTVIDNVITTHDINLLYTLSIVFSFVVFLQSIFKFIRNWIINYLSNLINIGLSSSFINHLINLPLEFFERRHVGDIVSRFNSVNIVKDKVSGEIILAVIDLIMSSITIFIMFFYSFSLTLIAIIIFFFYFCIRYLFISFYSLELQKTIDITAKEESTIIESIKTILSIKVFSKESFRERIWQKLFTDKINSQIKSMKYNLIFDSIGEFLMSLERIAIISVGAFIILNTKQFSVGMIIAYIALHDQFASRVASIIGKFEEFKILNLHIERISDILSTEREDDIAKISDNADFKGNFQIENLFYQYSPGEKWVLNNLNFDISTGKCIVIIGESGSGKTTLLKIMMKLINPTKGMIKIDGIDINNISTYKYRSLISSVSQEDDLLTGSVADNISFFDDKLDFENLIHASKMANIHDEITSMKMSYDTIIGESGSSLSAGQKQRILLARAIYKNPKIIFLDEATNNLDYENESEINQNLKNMNITRIIVTHRRGIINYADKILDISNKNYK